jgi:hypothetical protein
LLLATRSTKDWFGRLSSRYTIRIISSYELCVCAGLHALMTVMMAVF